MHTVELLAQSLEVAEQLGYKVRHEWLGGTGGGACEFAAQKWIFVDLALTTIEQLEQVTSALRQDPALFTLDLSAPLRKSLGVRRAA
jgi:hypothetical protein